jgi:dTDP-N-acetylfucosamine:lipid II N-acetylfucosaminyltransferase
MILHLMHSEKFIESYINFINENLESQNHFFIVVGRGNKDKFKIPKYDNILYLNKGYNKIWNYPKLFKLYNQYTKNADKIIIHSFIRNWNLYYFYFHQKLLSKSYWVMWGSDLYVYNKPRIKIKNKLIHYVRTQVYRKISNCVAYTKGEYELLKKWYGFNGKYHQCFVYPSNLYHEYKIKSKKTDSINILIGNSADSSNEHLVVLEKLKKYKNSNIKIFIPLSYGSQENAKNVISFSKELFGDKVICLMDYIPFEKYLDFLSGIDIAIFAHKRQQAMGNIRTLLGLGKKVYMDNSLTSSQNLREMGIKIFDLKYIDLEISFKEKEQNIKIIKEKHSIDKLIECLSKIFEG